MCVIGLLLSLTAALIPTGIYGWFVNWLDRHEKEPWWLLALVFLWGAIPAFIIALVAQMVLDIPTTWVLSDESVAYELAGGSLWAPITEETAKGLGIVLVLLLARREMDSILDSIVYGAVAGLGFAFTENVLYFESALVEEGWGGWVFVVLLRTIPFGLNHAFFTGLTGAGLGAAYLSFKPLVKLTASACGLAGGMFFHGIHNLGASLATTSCLTLCVSFIFDWGGIFMLGVLIALVWRQEQSWMAEQLPGEIADDMFQIVISWRHWARARWEALLHADRTQWLKLSHLRQASAELAFKKHQLARRGHDPATQRDIDQHRAKLNQLGAAAPRQPFDQPGGHRDS